MATRPLDYQGTVQALKDMYQIDPAGPAWVETSDIDDVMYWAGRIGRGFIGNHIVTRDGAGFRIAPAPVRT